MGILSPSPISAKMKGLRTASEGDAWKNAYLLGFRDNEDERDLSVHRRRKLMLTYMMIREKPTYSCSMVY